MLFSLLRIVLLFLLGYVFYKAVKKILFMTNAKNYGNSNSSKSGPTKNSTSSIRSEDIQDAKFKDL